MTCKVTKLTGDPLYMIESVVNRAGKVIEQADFVVREGVPASVSLQDGNGPSFSFNVSVDGRLFNW
jgi:hypothetical protein